MYFIRHSLILFGKSRANSFKAILNKPHSRAQGDRHILQREICTGPDPNLHYLVMNCLSIRKACQECRLLVRPTNKDWLRFQRSLADYLRKLPQGSTPQDMLTQPEPDTSRLRRSSCKEQQYHRNGWLKHWKRTYAKKRSPLLLMRLYTRLTRVLSLRIRTLSWSLQQASIQIPCIFRKRWSNPTRPNSSNQWKMKSTLNANNNWANPNSCKELLSFLQYGTCNANAGLQPERFISGRHN